MVSAEWNYTSDKNTRQVTTASLVSTSVKSSFLINAGQLLVSIVTCTRAKICQVYLQCPASATRVLYIKTVDRVFHTKERDRRHKKKRKKKRGEVLRKKLQPYMLISTPASNKPHSILHTYQNEKKNTSAIETHTRTHTHIYTR
jgi:hypothetical protein